MKWVTRERPKIDRIACPWLIARFIDEAPEFIYVRADRVHAVASATGAIPYDVDGVELGRHRAPCPSPAGTTRRPSRTSISPADSRCLSRSMSIEMSGVIGCPGGRYSVSIWTPQEGQ